MKFISFHAGYPGSCHDSYVFQRMKISKDPHYFFDKNQYLLADSAYFSGMYVIPAFQGPALENHKNSQFNYHLAQSRVWIEHATGILKGRFSSLQEMCFQIRNKEKMKEMIEWIMACVILHNLLANLKEQWNEMYKEQEPDQPPVINTINTNATSRGLRADILPITLAHFSIWNKYFVKLFNFEYVAKSFLILFKINFLEIQPRGLLQYNYQPFMFWL